MKLLTSNEAAALDRATFDGIQLSSLTLMENAGRAVVTLLLTHYFRDESFLVLVGPGNNGGDGLVVARVLHQLGRNVRVVGVGNGRKSPDAEANFRSYISVGGAACEAVSAPEVVSVFTSLGGAPVVIVDALYGTGFRGEFAQPVAEMLAALKDFTSEERVSVVAIDIASGIDATTGQVAEHTLRAHRTVTFQHPKVGHVLLPGADFSGEVSVFDIGLIDDEVALPHIQRFFITEDDIRESLLQAYFLPSDAHKGTRGRVLAVGGRRGFDGSIILTARAALRAGAGTVTVGLENPSAVLESLSELMTVELFAPNSPKAKDYLADWPSQRAALAIGPGLTTAQDSLDTLCDFLTEATQLQIPMVIDADGLNLIAKSPSLWDRVGHQCILTPHPGEIARLLSGDGEKISSEEVQRDRIGSALQLSLKRRCWVLLKGARTVVTGPLGEAYVLPHIEPALATAGSGDVLTGIIAALLARGLKVKDAAVLGAYLHGMAGVRAGSIGVIASELADELPAIVESLARRGSAVLPYPMLFTFSAASN